MKKSSPFPRRLAASLLAASLAAYPSPAAAKSSSMWNDGLDVTAIITAVLVTIGLAAIEGDATMEQFHERNDGSPVLPYLKAEQGYQSAGRLSQGYDTRLQAGYAVVGGNFEFLRYWERRPTPTLDYDAMEALFRMSDRSWFHGELAYGYRGENMIAANLKPEGGFSFGAYCEEETCDPNLGLEADFRWADIQGTIAFSDLRARAVYKINGGNFSLFGGYRALRVSSGHRDGPEAGLSLTW